MKIGKDTVLWILAITASLILSANFFVMKEKERYRRIGQEKELRFTQEAKGVIEKKLRETIRLKQAITEELKSEKEWSQALVGQLKEKEEQVQIALNQIEKKTAAINELLKKIETERSSRAKLEKALKETKTQLALAIQPASRSIEAGQLSLLNKKDYLSGHGGEELEREPLKEAIAKKTVELEPIVVKTPPYLRGRVLVVNREYDFVVVDLGKADNLQKGEMLSVYRGDNFIAQVRVEKIEEKLSAATILPQFRQEEIRENDIVKAL